MGDPVLSISLAYEAENYRLDLKKVVSLTQHLNEPLRAFPPDCYPVFYT